MSESFDELPTQQRRILMALSHQLNPVYRRWGEPPDLMFVYTEGQRVKVREMGLPGEFWTLAPTATILGWIAECTEIVMPVWVPLVPPGLLGVGVRCEAVFLRGVDSALLSTAEVHGHPDAVLGRFACAVDRGGVTYSVETNEVGRLLGGRVVVPGDDVTTATGSIPEALDRMLRALLGVPLPPRPEDEFTRNNPWKDDQK